MEKVFLNRTFCKDNFQIPRNFLQFSTKLISFPFPSPHTHTLPPLQLKEKRRNEEVRPKEGVNCASRRRQLNKFPEKKLTTMGEGARNENEKENNNNNKNIREHRPGSSSSTRLATSSGLPPRGLSLGSAQLPPHSRGGAWRTEADT